MKLLWNSKVQMTSKSKEYIALLILKRQPETLPMPSYPATRSK